MPAAEPSRERPELVRPPTILSPRYKLQTFNGTQGPIEWLRPRFLNTSVSAAPDDCKSHLRRKSLLPETFSDNGVRHLLSEKCTRSVATGSHCRDEDRQDLIDCRVVTILSLKFEKYVEYHTTDPRPTSDQDSEPNSPVQNIQKPL